MRILHININYTGTTLHQLMIENLDRCGCNNSVFVPIYSGTVNVIKPNENVVVCQCFNKWDRLIFKYKQKKISKALEKNFNVNEYDALHAYTLFSDGNCARNLSKKYGIPYVVAIRNTDVYDFFRLRPYLRNLGVRIMLDADVVFFLSESYRKQVVEKYVPIKHREDINKKSYVIPNGIDDFWFDNSPCEENVLKETVKLLYVGRIDANKNISTTQKAMSLLREKGYNVSLTVVGDVLDKKVFDEIQRDAYTECITSKKKEELLDIYRNHNIFVMPSFTESFGLVYAEAMSQGLPVIYSKGQGFDEQFEEGEVGYHVSAYDAQDVADGIEKAITTFDSIKKNVVNAAKRFNWEQISGMYNEIYRQNKKLVKK